MHCAKWSFAVATWAGCVVLMLAGCGSSETEKVPVWTQMKVFAGVPSSPGSTDGTGSDARFNIPWGVAVDKSGNIYVAECLSSTIRKITPAGVVTTLAGEAGSQGSTDGAGAAARFNFPWGVAVDEFGNVYVADTNNNIIRKITPAGVVNTFAGEAGSQGSTDGTGAAARFVLPTGVAVDGFGNVYVTDIGNYTIRKVTSAGVVTTLAGTAGSHSFTWPTGVAVDGFGNVYVTDSGDYTIKKITPAGVVTTLAGEAGSPGSRDGSGSVARFNFPWGVAVDRFGNLYVADANNDIIRRSRQRAW